MFNIKINNLYNFDIKCPCCKRKLMTINLSQYEKPTVSIFTKSNAGIHNTETRCHVCKTFVAVDLKK
jgi:hypothetical protein